MKQVAAGVWQLTNCPRDRINSYLAGEVLIDTGTRWAAWRILSQLRGRRLALVALTHCHPDHQGSARFLCTRLRVPLACHAADAAAAEGRAPMVPDNRIIRLGNWAWAGPPCPVGRILHAGDEVAGFRVVHTPGHTPGHVVYFRERDRVALAGDVLANIHFLTGRPGLLEPPPFFSADRERNREAILTLWRLRPALICFGHGPPLTDMHQLDRFVARLCRRADATLSPAAGARSRYPAAAVEPRA